MSTTATLKWIGLALLGIAIAAAVAIAASNLASRQIGLASEPISAGDALAPAASSNRGHGSSHSGSGGRGQTAPTAPTTTPTTPAPPAESTTPTTTTVEPQPPHQGDDDSHSGVSGGGHGADD